MSSSSSDDLSLEEDQQFPPMNHEEKEYEDFIHPSINISILSVLQMILIFFMRHNLTGVALEDLLLLINSILGINNLPTSKYIFFKIFSKSAPPKYNFFCHNCHTSVQMESEVYETFIETNKICKNCEAKHTFNRLNENNYFITFSLESQLREMILKNKKDFIIDEEKLTENKMTDIQDGLLFKKKSNIERIEISLTLNTDGVQVFKSKSKSLWPVQVIVNNLNPIYRFKTSNIIVTALWFNTKHPPMKVLLKPLIEEIVNLREKGLTIVVDNEVHVFNVSILCATLDAPAKSNVQNIIQFNGFSSCSYCEHPGTSINSMVRYPNIDLVKRRENDSAIKHMLQAREKNAYLVKTRSNKPLATVNGFKGMFVSYILWLLLY